MNTTFILLAVCLLLFYMFHKSIVNAELKHKYERYLKESHREPKMTFEQFKERLEDMDL